MRAGWCFLSPSENLPCSDVVVQRFLVPKTRMNPLYSILYKTKLPFILVFNKTDVQPYDFALEWMSDFEEFQAALASHSGTRDSEGEPTYMNSLMNSMSLVLDEFYKNLKVRPDSAFYFDWDNIWS